MIRIEHLYKGFGDVQVLKDISIEYRQGLCNMIIGASGSGKTVLLKTIIGLMEPDSGTVTFNGQDISELPYAEKKRFRQHIGVLFQNSALFDFATVIENVMFPMDFFTDWSRKEKIKRAKYCLERVNVTGNEKKYPGIRAEIDNMLASRLSSLFNNLSSIVTDDLRTRVWDYLNYLSDCFGTTEITVTHKAISQDLNCRREVVTRILSSLADDGLVSVSRGKIRIMEKTP